MKKGYTHMTFVLDASGSMKKQREEIISGFNQLIEDQKKVEGEATIAIVTFASTVSSEFDFQPIKEARPLDIVRYNPEGYTALYDGACAAIDRTGERLSLLPEGDRPERVLVVIMTDGQENNSKRFSKADLHKRIRHQTDVYGWEIAFYGSSFEEAHEARSTGAGAASVGVYDKSLVREAAFNLSAQVTSYRVASNKKSGLFAPDEAADNLSKKGGGKTK